MSICLALSGPAIRLMILGGGSQALRKAHEFLGEGAAVLVRSPAFKEGFDALAEQYPCVAGSLPAPGQLALSQGDFSPSLFRGCNLFLAATGDDSLNAYACRSARENGIFCLSSTQNTESCARFMKSACEGGVTVAAGTGGTYPALLAELTPSLCAAARPFSEKLPTLAVLRPVVLTMGLEHKNAARLLHLLSRLSLQELSALAALSGDEQQRAFKELLA